MPLLQWNPTSAKPRIAIRGTGYCPDASAAPDGDDADARGCNEGSGHSMRTNLQFLQ